MPTERKYNWVLGTVVMCLGWLVLYATRTGLSSALKEIGDYWSLSEGYLGFLSASFAVSYACLQMPSGFLSDRFGPRKMMIVGFLVQAVGLLAGVLSQSPTQFLMARILTGAGQATYFACQQAIVVHILPPERRSIGTSVTVAGGGLGSALGFWLGKVLSAYSLGWKMPFLTLGVVSVLFILLVLVAVPEVRIPKKEKGPAVARPSDSPGVVTRTSVAPRFLLLMSSAHFFTMYGFYLMLSWLPYYLETVRKLEGSLPALIPIAMPLIMAPAAVLWGAAADKMKDKSLVLRLTLPAAALATIAVPIVRSPIMLTVALAIYGASGKLVTDSVLVATVSQSATPEKRGTILATFNAAGAFAMIAAPWATGLIAERFGSFDLSFYAAGLFNLAALVAYMQGVGLKKAEPATVASSA